MRSGFILALISVLPSLTNAARCESDRLNVVSILPHQRVRAQIETAHALIAREQPKFLHAIRSVDFTSYDQAQLDEFAEAWSSLIRVYRTLVATDSTWVRTHEATCRRLLDQVDHEFTWRRIQLAVRTYGKWLSLESIETL